MEDHDVSDHTSVAERGTRRRSSLHVRVITVVTERRGHPSDIYIEGVQTGHVTTF